MKNDIFKAEITDLSRGGAGVARMDDGRIVFIPLTIPGDQVVARILSEEKRYCEGKLEEVVRPSELRIAVRCPVFGRCGGCQWQHVPYSFQWATKVKGVLHALDRIGVSFQGRTEEFPASEIFNYRNRIQLRGQGHELGFYASRSHNLVPIEECPVARREINESLPEIRQEAAKLWNDNREYKVEIRVSPDGKISKTWNVHHSAEGFQQINDQQNQQLKDWICNQIPSGRNVFDLFGGSGNLSLSLSGRMSSVTCVDVSVPTVPGGEAKNVKFVKSAVLPWLLRESKAKQNIETNQSAILDPPRMGLGKAFDEIVGALERLKVVEVVAVGCDVDGWTKDVSRFLKRGWKLEKIALFDFFPQTAHVESVALLISTNI